MFDKNGSSTLEIFNIGKTTCFYCVTGLITPVTVNTG